MKNVLSVLLCSALIFSSFCMVSFAANSSSAKDTYSITSHDLIVSSMSADISASTVDTLESVDHYTINIPLTDKEFNSLSMMTRENLKDYLSNQDGLSKLTSIKINNAELNKQGKEYENLSLSQAIEGVIQPMSSQQIDVGVLTTVLAISNKNTTSNCIKKFDFTFSWSPSPYYSLTDSAVVGFSGSSLGLTNYTAISGWQQRMTGTSTTWGTKESITTSVAGSGVETHAIDPQMTDTKLQGGITFTVSNPKTVVTGGAYFTAWGQYAHTRIGLLPASASVGSGGLSWSVPIGTTVTKSTQDVKSNILTY